MQSVTCASVFFSAVLAASTAVCAQSAQTAQRSVASDDFDAIKQKADRARSDGRLQDAIDLYTRAVRLRPSWAEGHWYLGTTFYETEKYAPCRDAFAQVVRLQRQNGAAWAFKGLCDFGLKSYRQALADLTQAQTLGVGDPDLIPVARYHRAILLARFGQFEAATHTYAAFAAEGNASPMVIEGMGIAALRLPLLPGELPSDKRDLVTLAGGATLLAATNSLGEAEQQFKELVRRYPDAPNVHYLYGIFLIGDRSEQALAQFNEELRISPKHAPAMVQIAQEHLKRGELEPAKKWGLQAARLAPSNFVARRVLGQIELESNDVAGAVRELEAAVKLQPDSPSVHYTLARAYQRAGRAADAKREREEFSRLEKLQQEERGAPK